MGDGADSTLCTRFVDEFEADAIKRFAPTSPGLLNVFEKFYVSYDEANFEVHVFGVMKDPIDPNVEKFEVMFPDVLYTPHMDDSSVIESIEAMFGLDEETAIYRLKRAELIAA